MQGSLAPRILPRVVLELAPQQHLEVLRDSRSAVIQMLAKRPGGRALMGWWGILWPKGTCSLPSLSGSYVTPHT